jgi:hypothetical protein
MLRPLARFHCRVMGLKAVHAGSFPAATPPSARGWAMDRTTDPAAEAFNPWSVVNLVFHHLVANGLHPTLGAGGDPGAPAAELLRTLGIEPAAEGDRQVSLNVRRQLADLRAAVFHAGPGDARGGPTDAVDKSDPLER